jgi:hypothetical protein
MRVCKFKKIKPRITRIRPSPSDPPEPNQRASITAPKLNRRKQSKQRFFLCDLCVLMFNLFLFVDAIRRNAQIVSVSHFYQRNPRHPRFSVLSKEYSIAFAVSAAFCSKDSSDYHWATSRNPSGITRPRARQRRRYRRLRFTHIIRLRPLVLVLVGKIIHPRRVCPSLKAPISPHRVEQVFPTAATGRRAADLRPAPG